MTAGDFERPRVSLRMDGEAERTKLALLLTERVAAGDLDLSRLRLILRLCGVTALEGDFTAFLFSTGTRDLPLSSLA